MAPRVPFDDPLMDGVLKALPVHVLYFDRGLICRYAAPYGERFLGRREEELLGRHAALIFPGATVSPSLEATLDTGDPWRCDHLEYPAGPDAAWQGGVWRIDARVLPAPVPAAGDSCESGSAVDDMPPRAEKRGVLVSCIERTGEPDAPANSSEIDSNSLAEAYAAGRAAEARHWAALIERVRTKLTIIRGFTQLMRRRHRATATRADQTELERIATATNELIDVVRNYEADRISSN
jgi:hypothetical protein